VHEVDCVINDEGFGRAAADALHGLIARSTEGLTTDREN